MTRSIVLRAAVLLLSLFAPFSAVAAPVTFSFDIVTALGVLPLAVQMEEPGQEIEGPMAIVILGGLFTIMILNLLVLPTLAMRYGKFAEREKSCSIYSPTRRSSA